MGEAVLRFFRFAFLKPFFEVFDIGVGTTANLHTKIDFKDIATRLRRLWEMWKGEETGWRDEELVGVFFCDSEFFRIFALESIRAENVYMLAKLNGTTKERSQG